MSYPHPLPEDANLFDLIEHIIHASIWPNTRGEDVSVPAAMEICMVIEEYKEIFVDELIKDLIHRLWLEDKK